MKLQNFDLTIIYYTANRVHESFLQKTQEQLIKAAGECPIISVSHKPINLGKNICVGDIGRSHLNIYKQILVGCKAATSEYVAMAEDDVLYSYEHFHSQVPEKDRFLYDMNKWSIFTWTKPPMFSFRTKRRVVNHLIAKRKMLIEALEERFAKIEILKKEGWTDESINSKWGDPGRYEDLLGVTVRQTEEFYSDCPGIVFTHPEAYGYEFNHGSRKRLGDLKAIELPYWGRAEDIVKVFLEGFHE